jgi:hypothetical protein
MRDEYARALDGPTIQPGPFPARPVTRADADALARLMLDAYRGTPDDEGETLDGARAEVARFLAGDYGTPLLGESWLIGRGDGAMAASLACLWERRSAPLIAFVMTGADAKRGGLGRAVLARSLASLRAAGHRQAYAVITRGNVASERLFDSCGFSRLAV